MRSALFGLAGVLLAGGSPSGERFTNAAIGLSIEKPADWCVLSAREVARDHGLILGANPQMSAAMPDKSYTPLYAFTRCAGSDVGIASTVKVGMLPVGPSERDNGQERLQQTLGSIASLMADVKVLTQPEITSLAGTPAGHATVTFSMKANGTSLPVALEMWVIRRGSYFVLVATSYPPDTNNLNRVEVMKVVQSVKLKN